MRIEAGQFGNILKSAAELVGALGYDKKNVTLERWGENADGKLEIVLRINEVAEEITLTLPKPTTAE